MYKDVVILNWIFGFFNVAGFALALPSSQVMVIVGVIGIVKTLIKKRRLKTK